MIATHHIKVNGNWYSAGEEIPEETSSVTIEAEKVNLDPVVTEINEEPKKAEAPKKTTTKRRNSK